MTGKRYPFSAITDEFGGQDFFVTLDGLPSDCDRCWREGASQRPVSIAGRRRYRRGSVPPALVRETAHCHACCSAYLGRARRERLAPSESRWVSSRSPGGRCRGRIEPEGSMPRQDPGCRSEDWPMQAPRRPREPRRQRKNYSRLHPEDDVQRHDHQIYCRYFEFGRSMVTRRLALAERVECRRSAWRVGPRHLPSRCQVVRGMREIRVRDRDERPGGRPLGLRLVRARQGPAVRRLARGLAVARAR